MENNLNNYDNNITNGKDIAGMYKDLDNEQSFLEYIDSDTFSNPSAIADNYKWNSEKNENR